MTTDPSDRFVGRAEAQMGAVERLLKGLPGVSGYVEKETRRDADKRLRLFIAGELSATKSRLQDGQKKLLNSGGLRYMGQLDNVTVNLQTLIDRIKSASYGYAGFFDTVRIKEEQLKALHQFDVAMAARVAELDGHVDALLAAIDESGDAIAANIENVSDEVTALSNLYAERGEAITAPDDLLTVDAAPEIDLPLLETDQGDE